MTTGPGPGTAAGGEVLAGVRAGQRVTVRQRVPRPSLAGGRRDRFADAVGTAATGPGGPAVVRDDGSRVAVRPERVVAARVVAPSPSARPPRPPRTTGPAALDRLAAAHWPATETAALGDWELRAAGGFSRRANSALATGDPGGPVQAALDRVAAWYATRGLAPRISTSDPDLLAAAAAAGWRPELTNEVLTVRVADVLAGLADGWADAGPPVRLDAAPDTAWLADYRDADRHPVAPRVLAAPAGTVGLFATLAVPLPASGGPPPLTDDRLPGGPASGLAGRGRAVVSDGWAGLSCLAVAPVLRRRGLARLLVAHLLDAALDAGAVRAYLQVESDNAPALALYRALGFRRSHTTTYLRPPADRPPGSGRAVSRTAPGARAGRW